MSRTDARGRERLRVLMVSSEVAPFAYTGGLGDVLGGLSLALADEGADVLVVTPRYAVTRMPEGASWWAHTVEARVGWGERDVRSLGVAEATVASHGGGAYRVCFLDHPDLFGHRGLYGDDHGPFGDNDARFAAMCRGALAVAGDVWPASAEEGRGPDVIHAHDWHAALAVIDARLTMGPAWAVVPSVFTIHNLAFQGVFRPSVLDAIALPRAEFASGVLEHHGQVNLLRGAVALADHVTTVSPTYAREILTKADGMGLDAVLRTQEKKLTGIVNGIDVERFDPKDDGAIAAQYDAGSFEEGKARCKAALEREVGLTPGDGALFGSVGRLSEQKGVDLLLSVVPGLADRGARFVFVGSGDHALEARLRRVAERFPGRVACRIAFDEGLARRVYAGSDFFVVPSRYEPCGLTQLYAMRYGALPVVTPVGGLRDTVSPITPLGDDGTGLVAAAVDEGALLIACEDALAVHRDRHGHHEAVRRAMQRDSSWQAPARRYLALYRSLRAARR